jgi:hypothetical protein
MPKLPPAHLFRPVIHLFFETGIQEFQQVDPDLFTSRRFASLHTRGPDLHIDPGVGEDVAVPTQVLDDRSQAFERTFAQ